MVRVTGGEAPGGSSLAPKIGPLGLVRTRLLSAFTRNDVSVSLYPVSKEGG